ncbi:MAG: hypothetical protein FWD47_05630 [Treponema sp.]|nr:hypothetical protein [Treponema sp.]
MQRRIQISSIENKPVVSFNTGLDPRSFARTKMSQSLIEQGYIVYPNGSHKIWKPAGVNDVESIMHVWGPLYNGKRLDLLIEDVCSLTQNSASQAALQAVVLWIRAKLFLGEKHSAQNPGAAFICTENENTEHPKGSVFFSPPNLSNRCLFIEGAELDRNNCPDLTGLDAAAFCAGVMLYTILTGSHPYPTSEIYQDMREGVFLQVNLAAPALDEKLSELIQSALLLPVANKKQSISAVEILTNFIKILISKENKMNSISSLYKPLSVAKEKQAEREKKNYLFKQKLAVKTKRFLVRNKIAVIAVVSILLFAGIITYSMVAGINQRPTTEGMPSSSVIHAYFGAFSSLNHIFMESIINGADKSDLNAAITLMATVKMRQAYEPSQTHLIPAGSWKDNGNDLPAPNVFGVTDVVLEHLIGSEDSDMMVYRVNYLLWPYNENFHITRTDDMTLKRDRKGNWRITEIRRNEK